MSDDARRDFSANCNGHSLTGCIALSPEVLHFAVDKKINVITPEEIQFCQESIRPR
jgi:hypothetical protein